MTAALNNLLKSPARRILVQIVLDGFMWFASIILAEILRYDISTVDIVWSSTLLICLMATVIQIVGGTAVGVYRRRFVPGSFAEFQALLVVTLISGVITTIPVMTFGIELSIPRSTILIALPIAFVLMGGLRYVARLYLESISRPAEGANRTLIFGSGNSGRTLVRRLLTDPNSSYLPVGILDDDESTHRMRISNIPVLGSRTAIPHAAETHEADTIIVAVPNADAMLLQEITRLSEAGDLRVLVMPVLDSVLRSSSRVEDLRDVSIEDITGRHPVELQIPPVVDLIAGRRVLVTGAGGSIGSELCRQINKFGPAELMTLDRDETALQAVEIDLHGHGLLNTSDVILADIRDEDSLMKVFADRKPEVVFHAAALKHLPLLEQYAGEAWKTNVIGSLNVLNAARSVEVATFVNVSTDKAADPTSILGHSKRLAERLTAWTARETEAKYVSVRFGNVAGSRGSMLPVFRSLIESDQPVTVTHPEATRYFMTISEACNLVIQAGAVGRSGEALILDMGEPIKILDIARRMISMSGRQVDVVFTGLRPGEKLHEKLLGSDETEARPMHPGISHTAVPPLPPDHLATAWDAVLSGDSAGVDDIR